ncbi:hypothetical protein JST97_23795 [bacterium]|nr:hypothetical protein [bacterium]
MKILLFLVALTLFGCQSAAPPTGTPTAAPATPVLANQDQGWFTYFAPDGKYSLQFPKAPETKFATPQILMLACPLDKLGSNLSFVSSKVEKKGLSLEMLIKQTTGKFGKDIKVVKNEPASWGEYQGVKLEMEMKGNRVWVHMILGKDYLYQLIALQAPKATEDFSAQRQQFFSSFQFTQK